MKKVLAILLTLLILTTNVGVSFATHFCKGKAIKTYISIGYENFACEMTEMDTPCKEQGDYRIEKRKNCCENKYTQISIEDNYNNPAIVRTSVNFQFVAAFVAAYINHYSYSYSAEADYSIYYPPLLDLDIPVLIQSFLI